MVFRIFVEKKEGFRQEAVSLCRDLKNLLNIKGLERVRIINRYDIEDISEELFKRSVATVFSEPQVDDSFSELDLEGANAFAVEYLPGQFDQRADSAAQCIQFISQGEKPPVHSAVVYLLYGNISEKEFAEVKSYIINPVEAREASFEKPETIKENYNIPETVETLEGFRNLTKDELEAFISDYGLAMDIDDICFCQKYFIEEKRDPTITEIRMLDTYWSDHCRHTTFLTEIDDVKIDDESVKKAYEKYLGIRSELNRTKPVTLMDMGTIGAKYNKKHGKLTKLDESDEINACTVKFDMDVDGKTEPWLLLFKNETHNHPTEIEPFGGAATCIGGAIRDPLSGRAYVYGAMRVTGAADPTVPVSETIPGKLPQRKLVSTAAAGYSSYGNQIGLATGIVDEIYHPGYAAKRMEIGAVVAAAPARNVRREEPSPGDTVILLGGSTGRDGIGGATGSSKAHNVHSVETCGAEVQKGNAPEERKLQRLMRNEKACRMIKRCNDFGAGGVSVAIGELSDGLMIDLNAVPKKYKGLDGTELAISESQERMAVVVAREDTDRFLELAAQENLQAVPVAKVVSEKRLTMTWNGRTIVDISRDFLNSNGAPKHISIHVKKYDNEAVCGLPGVYDKEDKKTFDSSLRNLIGNLNVCSGRGLSERFDSTIGAGSVLMPFGGKFQRTPIQAMVQKVSIEKGNTDTCSMMAYGYNPFLTEASPFKGAYTAVIESVCKLIATGASFEDVYLTFQEYFKKPKKDPERWGQPMAALMGALKAQIGLGISAIGGKDSMSGSYEDIDVPPTLVSFAVTTDKTDNVITPEFKKAGSKVILFTPGKDEDELPGAENLIKEFDAIKKLKREGLISACYTPGMGGIAEAVFKMCIGNGFGFSYTDVNKKDLFGYSYGSFICELAFDLDEEEFLSFIDIDGFTVYDLGMITEEPSIVFGKETVLLNELSDVYENVLEDVYPCNIKHDKSELEEFSYKSGSYKVPSILTSKPRVLIPVFPGTNCEYDSARAFEKAGAKATIMLVKNRTPEDIKESIEAVAKELKNSHILFIPGGFSGGDEPDGSGKFITSFFRNAELTEEIHRLLNERDGLIAGICNGFQALVKLGLIPYGEIRECSAADPTLTFNSIGRHQSKIVRTRIASNKSPWLSLMETGDIVSVPISHGEGRFAADTELIKKLAANGQIATQYVDLNGNVTNDVQFNPNNSMFAIEGVTSPDGRVFGKMGHSERTGSDLYKNVPGNYDIRMFEAAVRYYN